MIDFLRRFFGLEGATGNRKVAGRPEQVHTKDVHYIKGSNKRLEALHSLYSKYQQSAHAPKVKAVYDKTLRIHTYLVSKGRLHELELFHVQHTDHFLNTFSAIIEVHEQQAHARQAVNASKRASGRREAKAPSAMNPNMLADVRRQNLEISQRVMADTKDARTKIPILTIPEVSINTYSSIFYLREESPGNFISAEIGYTSSDEAKAAFMQHLATRFGLIDITYMGNALVYSQTQNQTAPGVDMLPVIHWNSCPYALLLEEGRLFPVRTYRKR